MNTAHSNYQNDIKSMRVDVVLGNGKSYRICSEQQMAFMLREAAVKIASDLVKQGIHPSNEETASRLGAWQEDCGYATIPWLMSKLTPDEQERWKASYRFGGVFRKT